MKNYTHFLNPNHATIIFKCNFKTEFGQVLHIVGNIEELGFWDPSKSIPMSTDESKYPIWESTQEITGPIGMEIYYKYLIFDKEKNEYQWEKLEENSNRKHKISHSGIFVISDKMEERNSTIQKLLEPIAESSDFFPDFNQSAPEDDLRDKDGNFPNRNSLFESNFYKSLSYDSNQFNGNELNETFYFCFNVNEI